jgi:uncharacterized membrane protein YdjX (TVP38/TMEM64 family)
MHIFTFFVISTLGRFPGTLLLTMQGQAVRSENYRGFFLALGIAFIFIVVTVIYRGQIEVWLKMNKAPFGRI